MRRTVQDDDFIDPTRAVLTSTGAAMFPYVSAFVTECEIPKLAQTRKSHSTAYGIHSALC